MALAQLDDILYSETTTYPANNHSTSPAFPYHVPGATSDPSAEYAVLIIPETEPEVSTRVRRFVRKAMAAALELVATS